MHRRWPATCRFAAETLAVVAAALVVFCSPVAAEPVDFARDVQPILAKYCHKCHGPEKRESGLRLHTGTGTLEGGNSGPAIVPGKSGESLLIQSITGKSADYKMPPEGPGPNEQEVALLSAWIDQGAIAPTNDEIKVEARNHWSFQPILRRDPPAVQNGGWVRNPIDNFILARLEQQNIQPSPEADRATLIRRLSFDLLGLPPTPAEVDEYLKDQRPNAYDELVNRLLQSPHYGERWGRHWLDQARYADSNGFTIDGPRSIWKYRDWVIAALNRDLPFDQFSIEQLAGDMLPGATTDQIVATGFHRNTLINQEGGTDPEQFRVESVVDRVNTTGSVFLGLTVGCAQCHTHKYDPITQREYYQLYAFLNNADEPTIVAPSAEQAEELAQLRQQITAAEQALREHDTALAAKQPEWEQTYAARQETVWTVIEPREFTSSGGALMTKLADQSILLGGQIPANDTYTVTADSPLGGVTAVRVEVLRHNTLSNGGPGLSETGNFVLTDFKLTATPLAAGQPMGEAKQVAFSRALADDSAPEWPVDHTLDDGKMTGWAFTFVKGQPNTEHRAIFLAQEDIGGDGGSRLTVTLDHQYVTAPRSALGRFQLLATTAPRESLILDEAIRKIIKVPSEQRTGQQREQLAAEFRRGDPARAPLATKIADLKRRERDIVSSITTTMVMQERPQPRETHVQIRGDFLRPGAKVQPAVLAVLPPLPSGLQNPTRLDLARWLVSPENPLTPRVTVNRVWQQYFGVGLVETENDFGTQGSPPTHPELLDWLASEFVRLGWSQKALHRLIVGSATYRQTSHIRPDLSSVDPRNKLLARQSRLRLEAEVIRDVALASSGLLSPQVGGPGVFPPQPEGIYRFTQQDKQWKVSDGPDRFRRGMYTYFWRSSPYPFLVTFDAPQGNATCTRRVRSNTPLQALTLANDSAFVEIAQGLAGRVLRESPASTSQRLRYAFRLCLAREPSDKESQRLEQFFQAQAAQFQAAGAAAEPLAPKTRPADIPVHEAAAHTAVSRVLLNLDEFVTRE